MPSAPRVRRTSALTLLPGEARLHVRLTPDARRASFGALRLDGDGQPWLDVRVTARPVEGRANQALIAALADHLGIPKSALSITSGATSRTKVVTVAFPSPPLVEQLQALAAGGQE